MSATRRSLISELEGAIQKGSKAERIDTLRRITDLFLATSDRLNVEQIDVFDEVIGHIVKRMEARALAELSERLAPIEKAPIGVIRSLARDEEIAVAGPVLSASTRLTNDDLVEIASTKGQAHLLAISGRRALAESVTDVLVRRGDLQVHRKLAASPDAQFSDDGMSRLVRHAEKDDLLTEKLGLRLDLPLHLLRELLAKASEIVREKLMRFAPASHRDDIKEILAKLGQQVIDELPAAPDFDLARRIVHKMHVDGELDEVALLQFVKRERYAESVMALSQMCATPHDILHRLFQSDRNEALIVPCRAAGLSWTTVRAFLVSVSDRHLPPNELEELKSDYARLSQTTAQRVLRFWCVQKAAGKETFFG
jgi:uncharacterized protein (DUF2336 family)